MLVLGLAAMTHAQEQGRNQRRIPAAETATVSGSLIVAHGMPALKSGEVIYFVGGLNRLAGFVDGLKEGAQVTIDGMVLSSPRDDTLKFLRPSKLTLNGKTYDLAPPEGSFGFMGPRGARPGSPRQPGHPWPQRPNGKFGPYGGRQS